MKTERLEPRLFMYGVTSSIDQLFPNNVLVYHTDENGQSPIEVNVFVDYVERNSTLEISVDDGGAYQATYENMEFIFVAGSPAHYDNINVFITDDAADYMFYEDLDILVSDGQDSLVTIDVPSLSLLVGLNPEQYAIKVKVRQGSVVALKGGGVNVDFSFEDSFLILEGFSTVPYDVGHGEYLNDIVFVDRLGIGTWIHSDTGEAGAANYYITEDDANSGVANHSLIMFRDNPNSAFNPKGFYMMDWRTGHENNIKALFGQFRPFSNTKIEFDLNLDLERNIDLI